MADLIVDFDIRGVLGDVPILMGDLKLPFRQKLATALSPMNSIPAVSVQALECLYAALMQDGVMASSEISDVATMTGRLAYLIVYGGWMSDIGMPQRAAEILAAMRQVVENGKAPGDAGGPDVGADYRPVSVPEPAAFVPPSTPIGP